jgi:DNA-binding NarL/FixJ family response regulator
MSALDGKTEMHALLLCPDAQFMGTTLSVLKQVGGVPQAVEDTGQALVAISAHKFDIVIVDWREIDDLAEFLCAARRSALNNDCVLVAIVRDVLDVRQAFAAGVHFLIHKPASPVQIERCLRTAFLASVARRRKAYRAPVEIAASLGVRNLPARHATILNLGEGGAGLRLQEQPGRSATPLTVGDSVSLSFRLPWTDDSLHLIGRIVWSTATGAAGVQFTWITDAERVQLECWLTQRMECSVAELRSQLAAACA